MIISKNSNISQSLMKRSIIINVIFPDLIPPTPGLLLNLFYTGIYDKHNPNHQRGKTKLTKQKNKIVDYLIIMHRFFSEISKTSVLFENTIEENTKAKYPEGKLINNCDWQVEPDHTLNAIYKGIEINHKIDPFILDSNVKKIFRPCRL